MQSKKTSARDGRENSRIIQMIIVPLRSDLGICRVGRIVVLPIDIHEARNINRSCLSVPAILPSHRTCMNLISTHFVVNGSRVGMCANWGAPNDNDNVDWKPNSIAISNRIGIAASTADWTSELIVEAFATCPRVAVKLDEVEMLLITGENPGIWIPRLNSTNLTTWTKFFWTREYGSKQKGSGTSQCDWYITHSLHSLESWRRSW